MIALFLGSAMAMFIALLAGDYAGHGRASVVHKLTFGARSTARGLGLIFVAALASGGLLYLLILLLRLIF